MKWRQSFKRAAWLTTYSSSESAVTMTLSPISRPKQAVNCDIMSQLSEKVQGLKRNIVYGAVMGHGFKNRFPVLVAVACIAFSVACSKPPPTSAKAAPAIVKPGTTLVADPNPIVTSDGSGLGETSITWISTAAQIELRIGGPNGKLFARGGSKGSAPTGHWVGNGMTFYLQDLTAPDPTADSATLGRLTVVVQ